MAAGHGGQLLGSAHVGEECEESLVHFFGPFLAGPVTTVPEDDRVSVIG
jgi:hypothetical protein